MMDIPKYAVINAGKYYTGITKDGHTMFTEEDYAKYEAVGGAE